MSIMPTNGPQPPPPPPPPFPPELTQDNVIQKESILQPEIVNNLECTWASHMPELRKACQRYRLCITKEPYLWSYKHFESLLQIGPTCGIVALSMFFNQRISPENLLRIAKEQGYTNNGEMFSVTNMCNLLEIVFGMFDWKDFTVKHCRGKLSSEQYVKSLIEGCLMLVPYDSDRNHSPCLKNGNAAHWALIAGILITERSSNGPELTYNLDDVYIMAKHGKSLHLSLWRLKGLEESNCNLREISQKRAEDDQIYILPKGGLDGEDGLNEQFILIRHIENSL